MKPKQATSRSKINRQDLKGDRINHYMLYAKQWEQESEAVDKATKT